MRPLGIYREDVKDVKRRAGWVERDEPHQLMNPFGGARCVQPTLFGCSLSQFGDGVASYKRVKREDVGWPRTPRRRDASFVRCVLRVFAVKYPG